MLNININIIFKQANDAKNNNNIKTVTCIIAMIMIRFFDTQYSKKKRVVLSFGLTEKQFSNS